MPRFLVKRVWGEVDEATMAQNGLRSRQTSEREFPEVVWEHSHVAVDPDGAVISFCVYEAPDQDRLIAHSRAVGAHFIDELFEIAGDVTPNDFPREPPAEPSKPAGPAESG